MDCCIPNNKPSLLDTIPSSVKHATLSFHISPIVSFNSTFKFSSGDHYHRFSLPITFACIRKSSRRASVVVGSSLNAPLEPKSLNGKFLSGVLQNDPKYFHVAVALQLERLVAERDKAVVRKNLSIGSDEALLHRRIAELKEKECQTAVEDVMYMLISYKFSEIRVHLVPRLSKCIYNSRLEIWPSKDWELESIHSFEVLEMIKEHLTTVIGWRANSNVTDNWAIIQIQRLQIFRVYAASILYGYFLKSASLRHHLELNLDQVNYNLDISHLQLPELWPCGLKNTDFGHINDILSTSVGQVSCNPVKKREKLGFYVTGFDPETLQMCAKPKSKEAVNLIERHSCALFGDEKTEDVISTSLATLKRFVLEAVAFGSFLWDTEEFVNDVYKLKEN